MTKRDKVLMGFGTLGAIVAGFLLPCIALCMGAITNTYSPSNTKEEVLDQMKTISL